MILQDSYTEDWINHFRSTPEYRRINPPVVEKMIHALGLLEKLSETGFDFIFKGGSSLILLLDRYQRFSIDIDIITTQPTEELEKALKDIVNGKPFTSFKLDQERIRNEKIPKSHYDVFYNSSLNPIASITLDVLFEESPYPVITERVITSQWINTTEPYRSIKIPDIDSILGDKLTAFAPITIGVPYYRHERSMATEIIKQLFDIAILLDHSKDILTVFQSFRLVAENQMQYRGVSLSMDQVFEDIFQTSLIIARRDRNDAETYKKYFQELQQGITAFNQFLIAGSFRIEDAVRAAGKTAWLASILRTENFNGFKRYEQSRELNDAEIKNVSFNFLNRLKRTDMEAFYYWYQALMLVNLSD